MNLNKILGEEIKRIELSEEEWAYLEKEAENFVEILEKEIARQRIEAEIFIGGSFAKKTLVKKEFHDIDIFVRFDWKFDNISDILERIVKKIKGFKIQKVHGSRDYYKVESKNIIFEIVPVYKIKKPSEARNVTDLSYFHVGYVRKKLRGGMAKEVLLAKQFCQAQGLYGAESYIQGFSGYALECLIIHYKSFLKMIRVLSKAKDRVVTDPEKHYKKTRDILFALNESRLQSPIVLVDPTWKERNVLAALNRESFRKFQETAKRFLKKPSREFFKEHKINVENLKKLAQKKKGEFVHLQIETDRQEGDIAGTKMKKFAGFLERELGHYFEVIEKEFEYSGREKANLYLIVKAKKEILLLGPPINMEEHTQAFRKKHKEVFEEKRYLFAKKKINFSAKQFLGEYKRERAKKIREMKIISLEIFSD